VQREISGTISPPEGVISLTEPASINLQMSSDPKG